MRQTAPKTPGYLRDSSVFHHIVRRAVGLGAGGSFCGSVKLGAARSASLRSPPEAVAGMGLQESQNFTTFSGRCRYSEHHAIGGNAAPEHSHSAWPYLARRRGQEREHRSQAEAQGLLGPGKPAVGVRAREGRAQCLQDVLTGDHLQVLHQRSVVLVQYPGQVSGCGGRSHCVFHRGNGGLRDRSSRSALGTPPYSLDGARARVPTERVRSAPLQHGFRCKMVPAEPPFRRIPPRPAAGLHPTLTSPRFAAWHLPIRAQAQRTTRRIC